MHQCYRMYWSIFLLEVKGHLGVISGFKLNNYQEFLFPQLGKAEFFSLNCNNAFLCCLCVFFLIRIRGLSRGQKVKLSNTIDRTSQNISNSKNKSVIVFFMARDTKLSTVITLSEILLRDQWSKKVKISNYFKLLQNFKLLGGVTPPGW